MTLCDPVPQLLVELLQKTGINLSILPCRVINNFYRNYMPFCTICLILELSCIELLQFELGNLKIYFFLSRSLNHGKSQDGLQDHGKPCRKSRGQSCDLANRKNDYYSNNLVFRIQFGIFCSSWVVFWVNWLFSVVILFKKAVLEFPNDDQENVYCNPRSRSGLYPIFSRKLYLKFLLLLKFWCAQDNLYKISFQLIDFVGPRVVKVMYFELRLV